MRGGRRRRAARRPEPRHANAHTPEAMPRPSPTPAPSQAGSSVEPPAHLTPVHGHVRRGFMRDTTSSASCTYHVAEGRASRARAVIAAAQNLRDRLSVPMPRSRLHSAKRRFLRARWAVAAFVLTACLPACRPLAVRLPARPVPAVGRLLPDRFCPPASS